MLESNPALPLLFTVHSSLLSSFLILKEVNISPSNPLKLIRYAYRDPKTWYTHHYQIETRAATRSRVRFLLDCDVSDRRPPFARHEASVERLSRGSRQTRSTFRKFAKMMVPRSFRYASAPPVEHFDEKNVRKVVRKSASPRPERRQGLKPKTSAQTTTEPVRVPSPSLAVPTPERPRIQAAHSMPTNSSRPSLDHKNLAPHNPHALPPAVAALLAVTEIPRPKRNQFRRRTANPRRMSIDELVNEWKNDDLVSKSLSSSPSLNILLEDTDGREEPYPTPEESMKEGSLLYTRSTSAESVPSLEADDQSILSSDSLSAPESLRSRRSNSNLKKEKPRSVPMTEECASNHPLVPSSHEEHDDPDDTLILSPKDSRAATPKPRTSFKSNLTSSLQALKNVAISSLSSFTSSNASTPSQRVLNSPMSDDMLWSHPFLFPRFSPEMRPAIEGTPSKAQRRYLNPMPLTFEEQETPYQLALHAPFLAEAIEGAPKIPMQTYSRTRRKSSAKRSGPDPQSEAGRALLGAAGIRQREVRENSDFLRIVVMEMNMRREGKLETGRAKIWLPPRRMSSSYEEAGKIPKRWVGESAY